MNALWASLPIVVALTLLVLRINPVWTALAALTCALGLTDWMFPTAPVALWADQWAMAPVAVEVAIILFSGLLLNQLLTASGAQQRLGQWVIGSCPDPARVILLVVLGVVPFAESVTGFGIGAIVGVPLLVHLGLSRQRAAVAGLLGLVVVPWGSLGPGTLVTARLAGVDFQSLGVYSALLSLPVFLIAGVGALGFALGWRRACHQFEEVALAAGALWIGILGINILIGTPLAGVLGSLFAITVLLVRSRTDETPPSARPRSLIRDALPYMVLSVGLLVSRALVACVPAIPAAWASVIDSPATWLMTTCIAAPPLLDLARGAWKPAATRALAQWRPVAFTTVVFLSLGVLMAGNGMSLALASAGAQLGPTYPGIAPWIGAVGGFLTGSNTGAGALFAASQGQTAAAIDYPVVLLVALQNVGAALATMAAIPRVLMATSVAASAAPSARSLLNTPKITAVLTRVLAVNAAMLIALSILALALRFWR